MDDDETNLHLNNDVFQHTIDHRYAEIGMKACKIMQKYSEQIYVAELDLPYFRKCVVKLSNNLKRLSSSALCNVMWNYCESEH